MDAKLKEVFDFISSKNQDAYKDEYLLANQVLSKNPITNNFIKRLLNHEPVAAVSIACVALKLFKYYFNNIIYFLCYLFRFVEYYISGQRFACGPDCSGLVLIDTPFNCDHIKRNGSFRDMNFPGLEDVLGRRGYRYAYIPSFLWTRPPEPLLPILTILKKQGAHVLSEYQLLKAADIVRLFVFVCRYPFHVLRYARTVRGESEIEKIFKAELIDTLHQVAFHSYARLLAGKRLARLPSKRIKIISWYENQVAQKCFYKGLRQGSVGVTVYGAQLFVYPKDLINIFPDELEQAFGIVPDVIVVNGPEFLPKKSPLRYVVGPSLRYAGIFDTSVNPKEQQDIIVLLSYSRAHTRHVLDIFLESFKSGRRFLIKAHPFMDMRSFERVLPKQCKIVEKDVYELLKTARMVIGAETGTLVEAAAIGIPVIVIGDPHGIEANPLPEVGEGVIWKRASNSQELMRLISFFDETLKNNSEEIARIARGYKNNLFCQPTKERICAAFGL